MPETTLQSSYQKTFDDRYIYQGFGGCRSICRLEIYQKEGQVPVAIVTELDDNGGTSVTNRAEVLVNEVCQQFGLRPACLIWLECYECNWLGFKQRGPFDMVHFQMSADGKLHSPQWMAFGQVAAEARLGCSLAEPACPACDESGRIGYVCGGKGNL